MIQRLNHIGISVADMARSVAFYRDVLGMEVLEDCAFSGTQYEQILGLAAARGTIAFLRSPGLQLELFSFVHPSPRPKDLNQPVCDHGISHFCIEVEDIQGVYARLEAAGVVFHCPPLRFVGVATATYARDPDGNVFEIMERTENVGGEALE